MNTDQIQFRVAIRQKDGTYKRSRVLALFWKATALTARVSLQISDNEFAIIEVAMDGENAFPEQATGVLDRKGNMIFAGDIVNMYIPCEDAFRKCRVEYVCEDKNSSTAQWVCRYLEGSRQHQFFGNPMEITTEYLDGSYCEITGEYHDR